MRDVLGTAALVVAAPLAVVTWQLAPGLFAVVACVAGFVACVWAARRLGRLDDPHPNPDDVWLPEERREWR